MGSKTDGAEAEVHQSERSRVRARAEREASLDEVDWLFYTTYASEQCKESITHMQYEMTLPDFLKLHEYTLIMTDLRDEEYEKAKKQAERDSK